MIVKCMNRLRPSIDVKDSKRTRDRSQGGHIEGKEIVQEVRKLMHLSIITDEGRDVHRFQNLVWGHCD